MLERIFLQVINMSYIASIVIVFILVARLLLAKAPKKYSYILWAVALVRLIVPISFESVLSLIPVNPTPVSNDVLYDISPNINTGMANIDQSISGSLPSADVVASVNPMQVWIFIGSLIWILGIAILLIYGMVSLIRMKGKLKKANCEKDNIYQSDNVTTAFVLGLIQPKIYLPASLSESEKEYILLHEQAHIKRFDHIIRFLSYLVLCIHWFNPLVWIAFWLSGKDMEMSCDESVINQLGHSVKKDYSQSLLNLATGRTKLGLTPLAFGEGDTKGRIKNILNFKQPKFYIIVVAVMIIVVAAIGLISNPKTLEVEDKYTYTGETNINIENRQFILEDVPKTLAEESVANVFLYSITAEFDRLSDVMADIDSHRISIENQEKSFNDGNYIESYIIHEISTLSENEYNQNRLDDDELNPLYYYGWKEIIAEYNLTEYEVINAKFTQKHSEKSIALGPQIGDGTYSRSFIIGKSTNDNDYKIYDFGMITDIGSNIND